MGTVTTAQVSVVLSVVVCLVMVLAGGWYYSLFSIQLTEEHYHNQEQAKHIEELSEQISKQNDKINEQQLLLEQLNVIIYQLLDRNGKVPK